MKLDYMIQKDLIKIPMNKHFIYNQLTKSKDEFIHCIWYVQDIMIMK